MRRALTLIVFLAAACIQLAAAPRPIPAFKPMCDSLTSYLSQEAFVNTRLYVSGASVSGGKLNLVFSNALSEYPLRQRHVHKIYSIIDATLPSNYKDYAGKVSVRSDGKTLDELVSKFFAASGYNSFIKDHIRKTSAGRVSLVPLITRVSEPNAITHGLQGRHIALWQSHGYYYEQSLQRWEWQRGRLMQTVEDLYTQSYVIPFLLPMLENAGANVLLPRERDWNTTEIIVDNDVPSSGYVEKGVWTDAPGAGFREKKGPYLDGENPFEMGTARFTSGSNEDKENESTVSWTPSFPKSGRYAVYVSYQSVENSTTSALYKVKHNGGTTLFSVNQKMGGGTWICLGFFDFDAGSNGQGVYLSNSNSNTGSIVSVDAVKFGGGMGNVARSPLHPEFEIIPETSGYPRAAEGSRYWLQWAGFTDTIYSPTAFEKDYTDDFQSRAKWVNALAGGSYVNPGKSGYNIPLDLSFAFHSDAGIAPRDSTIGTLAIFTRVVNGDDHYPNGEKRDIARDYADAVQSQIVSDIQATYDPFWTRRSLRDKSYNECSQPDVPAMILELLSHQNFNDMRYGLDPGFRFVVSRAIYKGILKFLAYLNDTGFIVQPLPVSAFSATLVEEDGAPYARLRWKPREDPQEPTASPDGFIVYTRIDGGGFDNGILADGTSARIPIERGHVYSFKVAAYNAGGRGFDSEILSVGAPDSPAYNKVLIVNNFDRLSGPVAFETADSLYAGFLDSKDGGVPFVEDISYCGPQYEFRRKIKWMDDDNAGFGASQGTYETTVVAGNTFDFPAVHGEAFLKAGYAFSSSSREAFEDCSAAGVASPEDSTAYMDYYLVDLICGKQTRTMKGCNGGARWSYEVFPEDLQIRLARYASGGGNLIVSGAYIASDLWDPVYGFPSDTTYIRKHIAPAISFVTNFLKYKCMSTQATTTGKLRSVAAPTTVRYGVNYSFNTQPNPLRYHVESPDAIVPAEESRAFTVFRYDNNLSAGVAYLGDDYRAVSLGFPIEALSSQEQIDALVASILKMMK
ncbi:MAG: xanthan lyase [Bacteroidales bacterium]|nr:xanthan lyase [Bacteroidales bacterium]